MTISEIWLRSDGWHIKGKPNIEVLFHHKLYWSDEQHSSKMYFISCLKNKINQNQFSTGLRAGGCKGHSIQITWFSLNKSVNLNPVLKHLHSLCSFVTTCMSDILHKVICVFYGPEVHTSIKILTGIQAFTIFRKHSHLLNKTTGTHPR